MPKESHLELIAESGKELLENMEKVLQTEDRSILIYTTEGEVIIGNLLNYSPDGGFRLRSAARVSGHIGKYESGINLGPNEIKEVYLIKKP